MSDYDLIVVGSDFAGSSATLSFLETAERDMDGKSATGIEPPKSNWTNPTETPPSYGFPMTANLTFTYGGIKTDPDARILSPNGVLILGLYAAGEMTGLVYHEYPPVTSVLRLLTFGRIAGTNVAKALSGAAAPTG